MRFAIWMLGFVAVALAQPTARDIAVAKQLAQEVERQTLPLTDSVVIDYVDRIAQKMAKAAELSAPLTVKVTNGDTSCALPGAELYVDTGVILSATSEAELAGAIAHVLGHLALWRVDPAMAGGQIPLIFGGSGCLRERRGLAIPMGLIQQQITVEPQADQLGLGYLAKAGYDPTALADFYERMLASVKQSPFQPWRVFPEATRTQAGQLRAGASNWVVTTSEFPQVQQRLRSIQEAASRKTTPPSLYAGK
jgi:predicted Zn-dependent protease